MEIMPGPGTAWSVRHHPPHGPGSLERDGILGKRGIDQLVAIPVRQDLHSATFALERDKAFFPVPLDHHKPIDHGILVQQDGRRPLDLDPVLIEWLDHRPPPDVQITLSLSVDREVDFHGVSLAGRGGDREFDRLGPGRDHG